MFEGLVLSVLDRVLGQYVEGLDRGSLKVAVWSGNVKLTDLKWTSFMSTFSSDEKTSASFLASPSLS